MNFLRFFVEFSDNELNREESIGQVIQEKIAGPALWVPKVNEWSGSKLPHFSANQRQYLDVKFKDGYKKHIKG